MIEIKIGDTPVFMGKFFSTKDSDTCVANILGIERTTQVLFVDTPSTEHLASCISALQDKAIYVVVRDHHGCPDPKTPREKAIREAVEHVKLLGNNVIVSTREEHPACSTLIRLGEFDYMDAIVADPDPDGLLGTMKALGVTYPNLDADAAVLDGPRSEQGPETLSPVAMLLVRGMAALPPYNPKAPERAEKAKGELFTTFVAATQGDEKAQTSLEARAKLYQQGIQIALGLAGKAQEVTPGVWLVDTRGSDRFDLATLSGRLEAKGAKITVMVKDFGPIASAHGCQYSLAVARAFQKEVNLQDLLPETFESSPQAGVISNTSFLLHVSEEKWENQILPELKKLVN